MMPRIDPQDPQLLHRVRDRLVTAGEPPTPSRVARALREDGAVLGDTAVLAVTATLRSELVGMGPIEQLLAKPGVTDVLVNGPDEVWLDEGQGLRRCEVRFPAAESVRRMATRLATAAGLRLDETSPFVELVLDDGARVHCALPPIAPNGPLVSIRVPPRRTLALEELVVREWAPPEAMPWLSAILGSRCNVLITGGTGSGKTTVLSSLLSRVAADDRLLLIEDSSELRPEHPHVVRLLTRTANVEGAGAVTMRDLVRQALRMRPDRIVVGEVHGAEVVDWSRIHIWNLGI